jgi:hypothetical protein
VRLFVRILPQGGRRPLVPARCNLPLDFLLRASVTVQLHGTQTQTNRASWVHMDCEWLHVNVRLGVVTSHARTEATHTHTAQKQRTKTWSYLRLIPCLRTGTAASLQLLVVESPAAQDRKPPVNVFEEY